MRMLTPPDIAQPFGRYSHGVAFAAGEMVVTSGQLGLAPDGEVPHGVAEQAAICFANIDAILREAGLDRRDIVKLTAYVTDRADFPAYMAARDAWLAGSEHLPASTLLIVTGFTRPEFLVEVEAMALRPSV